MPAPHQAPTARGSNARDISLHNFLLLKKARIKAREDKNCWNPRQFLLKEPHMNLLRLTPSELRHRGSSLKGTRGKWGGNELFDIRVRAGRQLSPRNKCWQRLLFL